MHVVKAKKKKIRKSRCVVDMQEVVILSILYANYPRKRCLTQRSKSKSKLDTMARDLLMVRRNEPSLE